MAQPTPQDRDAALRHVAEISRSGLQPVTKAQRPNRAVAILLGLGLLAGAEVAARVDAVPTGPVALIGTGLAAASQAVSDIRAENSIDTAVLRLRNDHAPLALDAGGRRRLLEFSAVDLRTVASNLDGDALDDLGRMSSRPEDPGSRAPFIGLAAETVQATRTLANAVVRLSHLGESEAETFKEHLFNLANYYTATRYPMGGLDAGIALRTMLDDVEFLDRLAGNAERRTQPYTFQQAVSAVSGYVQEALRQQPESIRGADLLEALLNGEPEKVRKLLAVPMSEDAIGNLVEFSHALPAISTDAMAPVPADNPRDMADHANLVLVFDNQQARIGAVTRLAQTAADILIHVGVQDRDLPAARAALVALASRISADLRGTSGIGAERAGRMQHIELQFLRPTEEGWQRTARLWDSLVTVPWSTDFSDLLLEGRALERLMAPPAAARPGIGGQADRIRAALDLTDEPSLAAADLDEEADAAEESGPDGP